MYLYIYNLFPLVHHTDFLITQTPPPTPKTKNPPSLVSQKLVEFITPQLHGTNVDRKVVSLGLEKLTKYVPRFPRLAFWTQKKIGMVYFPSAWFLKNLVGFVSLSFTSPTCGEELFHSALKA